jgi:hypothetical protein
VVEHLEKLELELELELEVEVAAGILLPLGTANPATAARGARYENATGF